MGSAPMNSPMPIEYLSSFARANEALMLHLTMPLLTADGSSIDFSRYAEVAQAQQGYLHDVGALWVTTMAHAVSEAPAQPAKSDKRFAAEEWRGSPLHQFLKELYLINSRYVSGLIERASTDPKTRGRMSFFARQILDAMSPANYLATNPKSLRVAFESGGDSVANGVRNLISDAVKGRISMTDETAFEVGSNLATTPGAVVFENELIQLIQYKPLTTEVYYRPLLLVPPAINKFYVLDLQPENSFVRYALEEGHTVFMLSWRNVSDQQGHLTWDDYIELGILRAINEVLAITGADAANVLGFCVGGTLLGCAAAVLAARGRREIGSLTFLTTMLDFSDSGEIGLLVDEASLAARSRAIGEGGIMPGRELAFVFSTLRSNDLIWPYVVGNYLEGRTPDAFDILFWNGDSTNLPGPMYCWYVRNAYLDNKLRIPGATTQCGVKVDLGKITAPSYVLAAREDHIVPWMTAFETTDLLGGPSRFVLGASGHIAGVINPAARNKRSYWSDGQSGKDANQWLATATERRGSWWSDWSRWLAQHAGRHVAARGDLDPAIEPAPGRYVKERTS